MSSIHQEATCTLCPNGCSLILENASGSFTVHGNKCPKGISYALEEYNAPKRVLTTTVKTTVGSHPRLCVKTSKSIPKELLLPAMKILNQIEATPPIRRGDLLFKNLLGLEVDVIATETIL